jgi:ribosome maturation factor RimP
MEPRHWRRARGRLVKAELRDGSSVEGRVTDADESGVELDGTRRIDFQHLARGRVQVEFSRAGDDLDGDIESDIDDADGDEG